MGLKFVGSELQAGLGTGNHRDYDGVGIYASPSHENKLDQRNMNSGQNSLEPQCYREEPEQYDQGDEYDAGPDNQWNCHNSGFI